MLKMIHDLDEMLYPTYPNANDIMRSTGARVAVEQCGLKADFHAARDMIERAISEKRDWLAYLVEAGVDADEFHKKYHAQLDHKIITPYPHLSHYFAAMGERASHVILTHSADEWAKRTVDHLHLRPWFPDDRILAWEKYKALKSASTKGFEMALEKLNVANPQEAVFADDSIGNLGPARRMGITTVWISHGRPLPPDMAKNASHVVENIEVFMKQQLAQLRQAVPVLGKPLP